MICSMTDTPAPDPDLQAYRRALGLQQVEALSRLAEIGMQLAEGAGARALAAQAAAAGSGEHPAENAAPRVEDPRAEDPTVEAREAGTAFARYALLVQRSLAQRSRAIDSLCARETAEAAEREAARPARRAAQRGEVEAVLDSMVWDETPDDDDRAAALEDELRQRIENLYADPAARTEDRPAGAVMAGLACGLGMSREWGSWARWWPATPRPARLSGAAAEIEAERNRRRDRVVAEVEQTFAEIRDPARIEGLRAGLALRLTEADAIGWLDTETTHVAALRLCRSLGVDPELCPAELDTG
jgi:AcrR family transcriptional regulator